jgi:hypothetical protein
MTQRHTTYSTSLAGAAGGILAWGVVAAGAAIYQGDPVAAEIAAKAVFGLFTGALAGCFGTYWVDRRVSTRGMAIGAGLGLLFGLLSAILNVPIQAATRATAPFLGRVIGWMLLTGCTAVGISLPEWRSQPARMSTPAAFGLVGGLSAGIFCSCGVYVPDVATGLGYLAGGIGVAAGLSMAGAFRGSGILQFVVSTDPITHQKYFSKHASWPVEEGRGCTIGNGGTNTPVEPGDTFIWFHDPTLASRHARVYCRQGRFFLSRAAELRGDAGLANFVLKVSGKTVEAIQDVADGDVILLGTTTITFHVRSEEAK